MAIDQITESAFSILTELRNTELTHRQLEVLQEVFQNLADKTGEILFREAAKKEKL